MFFVVFGILQAGTATRCSSCFLVLGARVPTRVLPLHPGAGAGGKEPLLSTGLFRNRTCNLALVTQNMQWLLLMGVSFVVSVFLQTVRGYSAIGTGVVFTAATVGLLVSSFAAQRLAKRFSQRTLIVAGFVVTLVGIGLLLGFVHSSSSVVAFVPGLLLVGLGLGCDADSLGERRAVELPRGACRARSRASRAACPTWARRSAPRSPARSWCPSSHRDPVVRGRDDRRSPRSGSSVSWRRCACPPGSTKA